MDKKEVLEHFEGLAEEYDHWKSKAWYYYAGLKELCTALVPPGQEVLEIGCGTGEILNSVQPRRGVGLDLSPQMVRIARGKFPHLTFQVGEAEDVAADGPFDTILLIDVVEHLPDVWTVLRAIRKVCKPTTQVIISSVNPVWGPLLHLAEKWHWKMPEGPHRWLGQEDLIRLLEGNGFQVSQAGFRMLLPLYIPPFSGLLNWLGPRLPGLRRLCLVQYVVAQWIENLKAHNP